MATLEGKFTKDDLDTLLDAMEQWEAIGNHEFHVMNMIRNAPLPPEDHEAFDVWKQIKDHFREREKEIKETRRTRQQRAVFLKAKLMLVVQDMGINQLFEFATTTDPSVSAGPAREEAAKPMSNPDALRLALAEYFIHDLACWKHYVEFLKEREVTAPEQPTEEPKAV